MHIRAKHRLCQMCRDRRAVTAVEYGLIAALILVVLISGLTKVSAGLIHLGSLAGALH